MKMSKQVWIGRVRYGDLGVVRPFKVGLGFWLHEHSWMGCINIFRHRIYFNSGCNYRRPIKTMTVAINSFIFMPFSPLWLARWLHE